MQILIFLYCKNFSGTKNRVLIIFFAADTDAVLSTWNFRELWGFSLFDSQSKISEIRPFVVFTKIAGSGLARPILSKCGKDTVSKWNTVIRNVRSKDTGLYIRPFYVAIGSCHDVTISPVTSRQWKNFTRARAILRAYSQVVQSIWKKMNRKLFYYYNKKSYQFRKHWI